LLAGIWRVKKLAFFPDFLPFRLDLVERIRFSTRVVHRITNQESRKTGKRNGFEESAKR
jgi:hypothetical protein